MTDAAASAEKKPKGEHPIRRLERENKEKADEIERLNGVVAAYSASAMTSAVSLPATETVGAPTVAPLDSDEWRFIEKCIAEGEYHFDRGIMTDAQKKFYNVLWAKLSLWRMTREIVAEIGVGYEWPQWTKLNRDPSTGKKIEPKPQPALPLQPEPDVPVPTQTAAQMPIRRGPTKAEIMAVALGAKQAVDVGAALKASIQAEVSSRAIPATREPAAASA